MLSIATGYNPKYLTGEVAKGTENYYTREVGRGEPPGIWQGDGAAELGLSGTVHDKDMEAVYVHFVDPRDPLFHGNRSDWRRAARLGRPPRKYATAEQLFRAALAREPSAEPERAEVLRRDSERRARKPVAFIDLTFGVPKSFSILHTALRAHQVSARTTGDGAAAQHWAQQAAALEQAIWAGNNAALQFLQEHAGYARAGYHGARTPTGGTAGRWIDAHGWIVASFLQHTNRNEDMHLHIHNAVLNRVHCTDGTWRTLDSRAIHRMRGAAGAIAQRVMTEHATRALGITVRWTETGHALEIVGISAQARALFSSRRREVTTAVKALAARFEQRHGRAPNPLELARLSAEAAKATRHRKHKTKETTEGMFTRFERQLRAVVDHTLAQIAHRCVGRIKKPVADAFEPQQVIADAVRKVQATKSAWTRFDLLRALHGELPPSLGGLDTNQVIGLVQELADQALNPGTGSPQTGSPQVVCLDAPELVAVPNELRLADGRTVFDAPAETVYATEAHLQAEEGLVRAVAQQRGAQGLPAALADDALHGLAEAGTELGADQIAAIRGLLCTRQNVAILIGPAGTGKSFVMGTIAQLWEQHTGRPVLGLATGQRAALVLEEEGFTRTNNVNRWLQRQDRLDARHSSPADLAAKLTSRDLVVLDEAAMTPTSDLAAVQARCEAAGARLIVVGDERQLGAVGAGGAFRLMSQHAATIHTLDEVRRFTAPWERHASLRLRDGDASVISVYERHARIVDAGTAQQAADAAAHAWLADTLAGHQSLILVSTGEQAADVSARLRARLVDLGLVEADGVALHHHDAQGTAAGVGDLIQTRRNHWQLSDPAGRAVINRDMWQVTAVTHDGSLQVRRITGHHHGRRLLGPPIELPADYVSAHVTLAYAVTAHSAQGSTVDTCYPIITGHTSPSALYVGMTRGRLHSVAHMVTSQIADRAPIKPEGSKDIQPGEERQTPGQVLAGIMQRTTPELSATELQRELLLAAESLPILGSRWAEANTLAGQARFRRMLEQLTMAGHLTYTQQYTILADDASGSLQRLLRAGELAGQDPYQLLRQAVKGGELTTARSVAEVLHWRITNRHGDKLLPQSDTWTQRTPAGDDPISRYVSAVAEVMDSRCAQLGERICADPLPWADERLGSVPDDAVARAEWTRNAGIIAGYAEQYQTGNDHDPIGLCPKPGLPDARAAWFAAWRALGEPTDLAAETTMDTAQLVAVVTKYERATQWAPDWVGGPLRHHLETARLHAQQAQLLQARARREPDPEARKQQLTWANDLIQAAQGLGAFARDLAAIDEARAAWHAYTDPLRQAAARAEAELARRRFDHKGKPLAVQVKGHKPQPRPKNAANAPGREAIPFPGDLTAALARAKAANQRIVVMENVPTPQRQPTKCQGPPTADIY